VEPDPAPDHFPTQGGPLARGPLRDRQDEDVGRPADSLQQAEELRYAIHRAPRVLIHDEQQVCIAPGRGIAARQGAEEPGLAHACALRDQRPGSIASPEAEKKNRSPLFATSNSLPGNPSSSAGSASAQFGA